jgi:hypothetical protein
MKHKLTQLALLCLIAGTSLAQGESDLIRKKHFNLSDGVALHGYDPVAYFVQGKAVKGNAKSWRHLIRALFTGFHQRLTK